MELSQWHEAKMQPKHEIEKENIEHSPFINDARSNRFQRDSLSFASVLTLSCRRLAAHYFIESVQISLAVVNKPETIFFSCILFHFGLLLSVTVI